MSVSVYYLVLTRYETNAYVGKGATFETREVVIRVPAGVEAGVTLRVRDSGNAGKRGGPRGDLFVQVTSPLIRSYTMM